MRLRPNSTRLAWLTGIVLVFLFAWFVVRGLRERPPEISNLQRIEDDYAWPNVLYRVPREAGALIWNTRADYVFNDGRESLVEYASEPDVFWRYDIGEVVIRVPVVPTNVFRVRLSYRHKSWLSEEVDPNGWRDRILERRMNDHLESSARAQLGKRDATLSE